MFDKYFLLKINTHQCCVNYKDLKLKMQGCLMSITCLVYSFHLLKFRWGTKKKLMLVVLGWIAVTDENGMTRRKLSSNKWKEEFHWFSLYSFCQIFLQRVNSGHTIVKQEFLSWRCCAGCSANRLAPALNVLLATQQSYRVFINSCHQISSNST